MTFGNKRKVLGSLHIEGDWEMYRFSNKLNMTVVGGAERLFKFFIKKYNPNTVLSFADKRYFNGTLYPKLGFDYISDTPISYWYIMGRKRYHRSFFMKHILIKDGFDSNKTAKEIMLERKIYRIYDCGNKKYIWSK
jgi:hypothetical protein